VEFGGRVVAESRRALRVLETAGAPCYYLPPEDVRGEYLRPAEGFTICEWKGSAGYLDVVVGDRTAAAAAWTYSHPNPGYEAIAGHVAFYPRQVECYLDGQRVRPQPGSYYGGWVTDDVVGPFKGEPGTDGW
jgi:uncharacterized protein (DUF427 family)